ncbi:hypothetical protein [Nocardia sputi]|uniref:hypothetical protein n=1 Tax=Nocardia sputi TaxID=2943705 RepID=UPI0020BE8E2D|nr:hypothetical protein [Nocardia sputi]
MSEGPVRRDAHTGTGQVEFAQAGASLDIGPWGVLVASDPRDAIGLYSGLVRLDQPAQRGRF